MGAAEKVFEDVYGSVFRVVPLMGSVGPCVDLEVVDHEGENHFRFTLAETLRLAKALKEAVDAKR